MSSLLGKKEISQIKIVEREECPACGSGDSIDCFSLWDDRYGFPELFRLRQCKNCGSFYLGNCVAEDSLSDLYSQYYPPLSLNDIRRNISSIRLFAFCMLNIAPLASGFNFKDLNVLDVGCGSGECSSIVNRSGGKWMGLDIDPKRVAAIRGHGLPCILGVPESIRVEMSSSFDVILASQVIEHSFSPKSFLMSCHALLKPGGILVLSTPSAGSRYRRKHAKNWINWHCPYHTVVFSQRGIVRIAESCGYSLSFLETYTPTTWWVRQKRYRRPPRGQSGQWAKGPVALASLVIAGICCRVGDLFLGDGDMIKAVFKKI